DATATNITANNNTITLSSTANATTPMYGIICSAGHNVGSTTNTVDINNNVFPSYKYPNSNNVPTQFINSSSSVKRLNINNNMIDSVRFANNGSTFITGISNATLSIQSNSISNVDVTGLTTNFNFAQMIFSQA